MKTLKRIIRYLLRDKVDLGLWLFFITALVIYIVKNSPALDPYILAGLTFAVMYLFAIMYRLGVMADVMNEALLKSHKDFRSYTLIVTVIGIVVLAILTVILR
jgi:hypothetical protein